MLFAWILNQRGSALWQLTLKPSEFGAAVVALEFSIHGFQNSFSMSNKTKKDRIRKVLGPPTRKTLKNPLDLEPLCENPWIPWNPWNPR